MQVKYGTRASSGGGRSSARETIGRVAAGAIAEKWLREIYGTEIVTFVTAVGTVDLPADRLYHPSGRPWTRAEIDERGALTILRDPRSGWKLLPATASSSSGSSATADSKAGKAAQDALDVGDEAAFLAVYNASSPDVAKQMQLAVEYGTGTSIGAPVADSKHKPSEAALAAGAYSAGTPCYEDFAGGLYDMHGQPLTSEAAAAVGDVSVLRTNELVTLRCPDPATAARMASLIRSVKGADDSTGGVLTTIASRVPIGLGEPVFDKAQALLAHAMLSLPATKGFELGSGFGGSRLRGSVHNDKFVAAASGNSSSGAGGGGPTLLSTASNNAGGTLGGITNGADIVFRVPIKPVSTIGRAQVTAAYSGEEAVLEAKGRHDPCVLPRAPPLVEAMTALVLADLALIQRARSGGQLHTLPAAFDAPGPGAASASSAASSAESSGAGVVPAAGQKRKQPET